MIQPSVSLIGSFRQHYTEVKQAAKIFADAGIFVKSPPLENITDGGREFVRFESDPEPPECSDHAIQAETLKKIFSSDLVYVVNPGGYIGRTTAYELGRIYERGMAVYYAEQPKDLPVEIPAGTVLRARDLAAGIAGVKSISRRPRVAAQFTADIAIFTIREHEVLAGTFGPRLHVLLIKRGKDPYHGKLALPGGFVRPGECLEDTAKRELREETTLDDPNIPLQQVHTYSHPERDPRGRIVTTAFLAIAPNLPEVTGATDAQRADWIAVEDSLWKNRDYLAFDHGKILRDSLGLARKLVGQTTVAADFCGELFTIAELRQVYEAVWDTAIDPKNFYKKIHKNSDFVVPTGKSRKNKTGRPAQLYRRGPARVLSHPILG